MANPTYSIDVPKLKAGLQQFNFSVGDDFFVDYSDSLLNKAKVEIEARVTKTNKHIDIQYIVSGDIELHCDRCMVSYMQPVDAQYRMVYSFDIDIAAQDTDDLKYFNPAEPTLDLSQDIYDFISLQVPLRKVPADCNIDTCENYKLNVAKYLQQDSNTNFYTDPRWDGLKNIDNSNQ